LEYLNIRKSHIILYTYDSILLDYSREDGKEVLKEIKRLLENEFGFKVNASFGTNYNELQRL
jgi:ABC-type phosphate/phosphonate transport system substrate-binding protein